MSGAIHTASDYKNLWRGFCEHANFENVGAAYFHHAEQFVGGRRVYGREDILRAAGQRQRALSGPAPTETFAFAHTRRETLLLAGRFQCAGDERSTLLTFALATSGRIRREWLFTNHHEARPSPPPSPPSPLSPSSSSSPPSPPRAALPVFACGMTLPSVPPAPRAIRQSSALRALFDAAEDARWLAEQEFETRDANDRVMHCVLWRLLGVTRGDGKYFNMAGTSQFQKQRGRVTKEWTLFDAYDDDGDGISANMS